MQNKVYSRGLHTQHVPFLNPAQLEWKEQEEGERKIHEKSRARRKKHEEKKIYILFLTFMKGMK